MHHLLAVHHPQTTASYWCLMGVTLSFPLIDQQECGAAGRLLQQKGK